MSSYHILARSVHPVQGDQVTIVLHLPTPAGNNDAGVPWSRALVDSGMAASALADGPMTAEGEPAMPNRLTDAEEHAVLSGQIYAVTIEVNVPQGADLAAIRALAVAELAKGEGYLDDMENQLRFFGAAG